MASSRFFRLSHRFLLLGALVSASGPFLSGQIDSATMSGRVTDNTGAVVPGASVKIAHLATGRERDSVTNELGEFWVPALPVGTYKVTVTMPGFKQFVQEGIVLEVNRVARLNLRLDVGQLSENVVVTGDAPLVETTQSTVSKVVDSAQILELPLNGRNTAELVQLVPGVTSFGAASSLGYVEYRVSTGGADAFNTQFLIDGGTNTSAFRNTGDVLPNPDAVAEFRVIRNMTAEYGRLGGAVVNTITRSGTNALHATLFSFHRNRALNAREWHRPDKSPLVQNQFGGSVGGPIVRDRTFFFATYQQLERRTAAFDNSAVVPTALERQGDFSQSRIKPRNPQTGQPYPGDIIPPSQFDPVSKNVLDQYVPLANTADGRAAVQRPVANDDNQLLVKIDHDFSSSHRVAFNYLLGNNYDPTPLAGNLPYGTQIFDGRQQNIGVSETWTASPTLINSLRLGYLRTVGQRFIEPAISLKDLGGKWETDGFSFPPEINVIGYFWLRTRFLGPTYDNSYQFIDTANWLRGRHNLKLGGELIHNRGSNYSGLWSNGWFDFNGGFTGNALSDYLIGRASNLIVSSVNRAIGHVSYYALFAQDDFRVSPRLMLNLGLRYEIFTPSIDPHDRMSTYIPGHQSNTVPSAPPGIAFFGEPGVPGKLRNYDKDNFGPRIGLAYDLFGDGRTAIRAGYGVSYSASTINAQSNNTPPYSFNTNYFGVQLSDPWKDANNGVSLLPFQFDPQNPVFFYPSSIGFVDQDWHEPYFHQVNLTLQQQLGPSHVIEVGYFGNMGRKLRSQLDINEPMYVPGSSTAGNVQARRPTLPQFYSNLNMNSNQARTDYHSMQASVKRRFSAGVTFDASYVLSKETELPQGAPVTVYDFGLEYGRSIVDARHRFISSFIWEPLWASQLSGFARHVLHGWQFSGIVNLQSGMPFTVTAGSDVNLNGVNNDRPNVSRDAQLDPNRPRDEVVLQWFDTAAFSQPAAGQIGTTGRNTLDRPGFKNIDLGINRNFRIGPHRLQFRSEWFNTFNWVNLSAPVSNIRAATAGRILTASSARVIQFGLKFFLFAD